MEYFKPIFTQFLILMLFSDEKSNIIKISTDEASEIFNHISEYQLDEMFFILKDNKKTSKVNFSKLKVKDLIFDNINVSINIGINGTKKQKLQSFFFNYLEEYKQGNLISMEQDFRSYDAQKQAFYNILKTKGSTKGNFLISKHASEIESQINFYELVASYYMDGFLTINKLSFSDNKLPTGKLQPLILYMNMKLIKSIEEIYDININWLYYGDIRVDKDNHYAYYKKTRYPFKSMQSKAYKLLCYLIQFHGNPVNLYQIYEKCIKSKEKDLKHRKNNVKNYINEIKRNLGIISDKNPTVDIIMYDDKVKLVSLPPKKVNSK